MNTADSLNEVLRIPGNAAVYDRIKNLLERRTAIAFVGAGASCPLYPLWNELIVALCDEADRLGMATPADCDQWRSLAKSDPIQVAAQIRRELRDEYYHEFLYRQFSERTGSNGCKYTPVQASLMHCNFKAFITTNYEPGLIEARRVVRSLERDTSFSIHRHSFALQKLFLGAVSQEATYSPILFAHGHYADPENIVLDRRSYEDAYNNTAYRAFIEHVLYKENLVFVGFSFNDSVLRCIAEKILDPSAAGYKRVPQHVAILGCDASTPYSRQMRIAYLDRWNTEVLFYPVGVSCSGDPDHSILPIIVDSLANQEGCMVPNVGLHSPIEATRDPSLPTPSKATIPPTCFTHQTTDDEKFSGRNDDFLRLDGWIADKEVRIITICGIGGLGKTALVGRWLRSRVAFSHDPPEGSFFWSFYRNNDVGSFLSALLGFAFTELGWVSSIPESSKLEQALELLKERRLIAVLDGLEVVQGHRKPESEGKMYAEVMSIDLTDLLQMQCFEPGRSVLVLTSRFPFPDLTPHLGNTLRLLSLVGLPPSDSSKLLESLGVKGDDEDRRAVSGRLHGHPLALRIFARSMPRELHGDPTRLWERIFTMDQSSDDSIEAKMRRLLVYYESVLGEFERWALGLLALFRMPVGQDTLLPLWRELPDHPDASALRRTLSNLMEEYLLIKDTGPDHMTKYSCHPILRDHFRSSAVGHGNLAKNAANILVGRPDCSDIQSVESLQIMATAIELLLDAGLVLSADDLYFSRLAKGYTFIKLAAPQLGLEISRWFVRDEARRKLVADSLDPERLAFYLNSVGLFAVYAGEPETAQQYYSRAGELHERLNDGNQNNNLSIDLQSLGEIGCSLGNLVQASESFRRAAALVQSPWLPKHQESLAQRNKRLFQLMTCRGGLGHASSLLGETKVADEEFAEASSISAQISAQRVSSLTSLIGVHFADHLLRLNRLDEASKISQVNSMHSLSIKLPRDVALCDWILGRIETMRCNWAAAEVRLSGAKAFFRKNHMIYELAQVLYSEAVLLAKQAKWHAALVPLESAFRLTAPRKYRLIQADLLNLRAAAWLNLPEGELEKSRDDAEAALSLARACAYVWAERDALELLARTHLRHGTSAAAEAEAFELQAKLLTQHLEHRIGKPSPSPYSIETIG